jgi:hypothetical protein
MDEDVDQVIPGLLAASESTSTTPQVTPNRADRQRSTARACKSSVHDSMAIVGTRPLDTKEFCLTAAEYSHTRRLGSRPHSETPSGCHYS